LGDGLQDILSEPFSVNTLLLGDFNQHIPRLKEPKLVHSALISAIPAAFEIATTGEIAGAPKLSIDHLCHSHIGV
jgi:hypothetical protein